MYLKLLKIIFNVLHYYINKRKICRAKHVQGIMLAHLNLNNDAKLFKEE